MVDSGEDSPPREDEDDDEEWGNTECSDVLSRTSLTELEDIEMMSYHYYNFDREESGHKRRNLAMIGGGYHFPATRDINKLKKENQKLRKEIWGLRDECDRLEQLLTRCEQQEEDELSFSDEEDTKDDNTTLGSDLLTVVEKDIEADTSDEMVEEIKENDEKRCETYKGCLPPLLRVSCVHPFTAAATVDSTILPGLTAVEVIESCWKTVGGKLNGVRMLGDSIYLSLEDRDSLDAVLVAGLWLRGVRLPLQNVSEGTLVVAMSGVPFDSTDHHIIQVLAQFGIVIGHIERRFYRSVDTGERLARVRPHGALPKKIFIDGQEVAVRALPLDELTSLTMKVGSQPRPTIQVKVETHEQPSSVSRNQPSTPTIHISSWEDKETLETVTQVSSSCSEVTGSGGCQSSLGGVKRGTLRQSRRGLDGGEGGPAKAARRRVSTATHRRDSDGEWLAAPSLGGGESRRESFVTDRRRLSDTGRETGKLPWFGCWGNGCI